VEVETDPVTGEAVVTGHMENVLDLSGEGWQPW